MTQEMQVVLPDDIKIGVFQPVAYFDKYMDCIRVVTHDRSVTEHRINEFLTIHECNHRGPLDPKYVGFTIKGVRCLFSEVGLSLDKAYKLAELIDRLVKHKPGSVMSATLDVVFEEHKQFGDLTVDCHADALAYDTKAAA